MRLRKILACGADSRNRFQSARSNERNFVREGLLSSKQGKDSLIHCSGELRKTVGHPAHVDISSKHRDFLPRSCLRGAIADYLT